MGGGDENETGKISDTHFCPDDIFNLHFGGKQRHRPLS